MPQYAKIVNNIVVNVIEANEDFFKTFVDSSPGQWIETDIFTSGGISLNNGKPLRGNYAGIGYTYDAKNDVFYAPCPVDRNGVLCNSWLIAEPNWLWKAPTEMPTDGKQYVWDEPSKTWIAQ
jgi:hypothetical protein